MDLIEALPGLTEMESAELKFAAENGVTFDDAMRSCVVRMIEAIQHPPDVIATSVDDLAHKLAKKLKAILDDHLARGFDAF